MHLRPHLKAIRCNKYKINIQNQKLFCRSVTKVMRKKLKEASHSHVLRINLTKEKKCLINFKTLKKKLKKILEGERKTQPSNLMQSSQKPKLYSSQNYKR